MFKETERYLKRLIKGKQKFTKMLVFTFLMTGSLGMAVPITPNANGEYIVNSTTGDGEELNYSGSSSGVFRISEGKKFTFSGEGEITSTQLIPFAPRVLVTLVNSNSEFIANGVGTVNPSGYILEFLSADNMFLYTVKDPLTGVYSNASNQKITLTDVMLPVSAVANKPVIKVEANNGYGIKNAEFNMISTNSNLESRIVENGDLLVEVEADEINGVYSELTINGNGEVQFIGAMKKSGRSVLNVNLDNDAEWQFIRNNKDNSTNSIINSLTLGQYSGIAASFYPTEADGETAKYTLQLTSDGVINDGTLVSNGGYIDLYNGSYEDEFTIKGNYHGSNGANISMNTLWNGPGDANGGNSQSDLVYITGNATGSTKVIPVDYNNADDNVIDGNVQQLSTRINSVPVVKVAGNSSPTTFTGTAKTTGAVEAQLTSRQVNGVWEYYWTIDPIGAIGKPVVTPGTTGGATSGGTVVINPGTTSGGGSPTTKPIYIMSQPVSSYVLMPKVNMELGYSTIGTLHERRSENQILELENMNTDKGQIWTRIYGRGLNEKGKTRFGYESNLWGVQVGHDFKINEDEKGNKHLLGGYIAYNNTKIDFFDKYRAVNGVVINDKLTGEGKSESISLGLTKTKYTEKGTYYDLVGQVSVLQNKYESRDGDKAKQKGYGVVLSAEVGKPFVISKNTEKESTWSFEPQAQLIYQYLNNKSFNDGLRKVEQEVNHGLRGRAGFRIAYNGKSENHTERTNSYYAVANIWHDFANNGNKYTKIGGDRINEEVGKTWGEIGLGAQAPVGEKSNLYIDTRYEHSLSDSNHKGYRATVGFKHTF